MTDSPVSLNAVVPHRLGIMRIIDNGRIILFTGDRLAAYRRYYNDPEATLAMQGASEDHDEIEFLTYDIAPNMYEELPDTNPPV